MSSRSFSPNASSGKMAYSSTRKSERLEKQTPLTSPVNTKFEKDGKHLTRSPMRRSERGKKDVSSSSTESSNLAEGLNSVEANRKKVQREKCLNELNIEAKKVDICRENDQESSGIKRKRMNARSFRALFKPQQKMDDLLDDSRRMDAPSVADYTVSQSSASKLIESREQEGNTCMSKLANDTGEECLKKTEDSVVSISRDVDKAELPSVAECASPSPAERDCCFVWTCGNCSKRLRVKYDSPEQELCSCNVGKDPEKLWSCGKSVEASCDPQIGSHDKVCIGCHKDGNLLFCHGMDCGNCYHVSCLDLCLGDVQPMVWHCIWCVKKKIESGVHSVSNGVEEIWDCREVVISDSEGKQHLQKQFLVKYHGLAHVHNHWLPETMFHPEASHVEMFIQKQQQGLSWNSEWTAPHRLLKKRPIKFLTNQIPSSSSIDSITGSCQYEWLVKWCNLGYEHASWELEDADFLQSSLGKRLVKEYDLRMEKVKRMVDKSCEGSYVQLTELPSGKSPIKDSSVLNNVNKLREFWYKNQNAVVFDDQIRFASSIFFILSLVDIGHSFLVISDDASRWETEFMQVAPSVDIVVYAGNEQTRRRIRVLEFYEEGCRVIPQVLLAPSEAALEDVHFLKDLSWGAILIDDLDGRVSTHLEQMKILTTNSRVILFASQLKDRVTDYLGVLSLLEFRVTSKCGGTKYDNNTAKLKDQLSRYVAYGCVAEPSKFVEYWVPADISNLQLEQYCATLLSNSTCLGSCSKNDLVGALRETLLTIKKCCNHPYLVDPTIQGLIIQGLPLSDILDVGIKASGKLQLLDMILSEIKARQLRVVILFQPIVGSAIGDILDDFLRQRFGENSYERIDAHVSKKQGQAALNRFNKKENGQFVFLLGKGGCVPSIKLASVDTVVMFDSDWNPGNDLRALQRISIDSQFPQIKVFRLYSPCTIEERALILAKQDVHIDNDIQNVSRSNTVTLLSWGVSNLFNRLEEFHISKSGTMPADIACEDSHANNVIREFQAILTTESVGNDSKESLITKVRQLRGVYCTDFPLPGESKIQTTIGEEPHIFWKNLLEDRNPCWRFPCSNTRNRKRVQYFEGSSKEPEMESGDLVKKRRKVVDNSVNPSPGEKPAAGHVVRGSNQSLLVPAMGGGTSGPSRASSPNSHDITSPGERNQNRSGESLLSNEQKSIHTLLSSEMEKLCEALALKEDVKHMLHAFLGYVVENHRVSKENVAIFQALQISLCWIAASMLKQKIDKRDSLILARQKLKFECSDEVAEFVYKKLRMLKKTYMQLPNIIKKLQDLIKPMPTEGNVVKDAHDAGALDPTHSTIVSQETAHEENLTHSEHAQQDTGCNHESETKSMLHEKQQQEIDEFHKIWEDKRLRLVKKMSVEAAVIRQMYSKNIDVQMEKLKRSETLFSQKLEEHKKLMEADLKDLKAKHLVAIIEDREKAAQWLAKYPGSENRTANEDKRGNDLRTSEGSQYAAAPVREMVDAAAYDIRNGTTCTPSQTVNDLHSNDNTLLDVCVDAPKEAEGCTARMEMGSIPRATNSHGSEVGVSGRISDLEDEEHNEVASDKSLPGEANYSLMEFWEMCTGEANELVPAHAPEDAHEEVRSTDDPDTNTTAIQSTGADDGEDRVIGYVTHGLLHNQRDDANATDPSADQTSLVAFPHELIDSVDPDTNTTAMQSTGANDGEDRVVGYVSHSLLGNQRDDANGTDPSSDQTSLVALPHEVIDSVDHAKSAPIRQAIMDELPECARSTEVESEDVAQLVTTNNLTAVVGSSSGAADNGLTVELDNRACFEQQIQLREHALGPESGGSAFQTFNDECTPLQVTETTPQVEGPTNFSQQHQPRVTETVDQSSSTDTANPNIDSNWRSPPFSNQGGEPSSGVGGNLHHVGQAFVVDDGSAPRTNRAVRQAANQLGLSNSHLTSQPDPLQVELEKLRKALEQAAKSHENLKAQLGSDLEKEIAEIRNKYEAKFKDAEAMFQQKKKALDSNVNKVFLNKILADAVSTKCIDVRPSGVWRQQGFMKQLQQISLQSTLGPANVVSSSAGGTPAVRQNTSLTLPTEPRPAALLVSASSRPPIISSISCPQNNAARVGGDLRAAAPHLQSVGADIRAVAPHLQPVGVDIRAAAPHLQSFGADVRTVAPHLQSVVADIRAAAPHLQPFRQPVSVPAPSCFPLPHNVTLQQSSINQPSLTLPSHVLPVHPQVPSPIQMCGASPQTPHMPTHVLRPLSRTSGSQSSPSEPHPLSRMSVSQSSASEAHRVVPSSYHTTQPSALELLKDIDRRINGVLTNSLVSPVVPDTILGRNEVSALHGMQGGLTSSDVSSGVVYLSDDD